MKNNSFSLVVANYKYPRLNKCQLIHMDIIERYRRITHYMFEDGIVNRGRLIVLRIYTDKLYETVSASVVVELRKEYFKLLSELSLNREWKH